ncbi:MAG: NAD(P)H-dependent oxidoreductase [Hyphomonadaceae bacterium]|nr:NAD(P)H-dependent oxidoreductase [Hyphomonadaceae bacterium]
MQAAKPFIVGIGGTTRANSTSDRLVRAVLAATEREGAATQMFGGAEIAALPYYAPEKPDRTPGQTALVEAVRRADGLVIGTPGYHGGVSGLVKNAIDLLEDLRGGARVYLDGRPVGLVVTAGGWQACGVILSSLRDIVHALRGWPTPTGIAINSHDDSPFLADGDLKPGNVRDMVGVMARQVLSRIQTPTATS